MRYKYTGSVRVRIPDAGVEVDPGDEFDCDAQLNNEYLVPVAPPKTAPAPAPVSAPAAEEA